MLARPGSMVEVEWVDSTSVHGWHEADAAVTKDLRCISVGYLLADDEHGVTLCQSAGQHDRLCSITIPRVAVQAVHRLRRA